MTTNTRFAVAVHILSILAIDQSRAIRSAELAQSVCTNPAVIRRLLCTLATAGLTTSHLGCGGGAMLAKPAQHITLLDVFRVVGDPQLLGLPRSAPNTACPIGCNVQTVLARSIHRAQQALERELAQTSIAQIAQELQGLPAPVMATPSQPKVIASDYQES
jgi:Rrf2 family protein